MTTAHHLERERLLVEYMEPQYFLFLVMIGIGLVVAICHAVYCTIDHSRLSRYPFEAPVMRLQSIQNRHAEP